MSFAPGAPLTNFNDGGGGGREGGSGQGSYFIPKKVTTSQFVYPQTSLLFLAITPKNPLVLFLATQKIPQSVFFFTTQKNSSTFHRTKKITFGHNFRLKKITWTLPPHLPPSLKYVSGAPGSLAHSCEIAKRTEWRTCRSC